MSTSGVAASGVAQALEIGAQRQFDGRADAVADAGHVGMRLGVGHRRLDEAVVAQHELEVACRPVEQLGGGVAGHERQDRLILQARHRAQHRLEDQALLGPELAEEGDLVDASFLGDPPGGGPAEPGDGKDLHRRFE